MPVDQLNQAQALDPERLNPQAVKIPDSSIQQPQTDKDGDDGNWSRQERAFRAADGHDRQKDWSKFKNGRRRQSLSLGPGNHGSVIIGEGAPHESLGVGRDLPPQYVVDITMFAEQMQAEWVPVSGLEESRMSLSDLDDDPDAGSLFGGVGRDRPRRSPRRPFTLVRT